MTKPSIADLLTRSGYTTFSTDLVQRAMYSLYGNIGAGIDLRDWDAIMAAPDPLAASEAALVLMYQDAGYLRQNIESLVNAGSYGPAQVEWTYREMYLRLGLRYQAGWGDGTSYAALGALPLETLLQQAQSEAAARAPQSQAAPTLSFTSGDNGVSVVLNVGATLSLSTSGSLGSFTAGTTALAEQASAKFGFMTATGAGGQTSAASTQFFSIGTATGESLSGDANPDYMVGGGGNDTLNGDAGDDILWGGADNDLLTGGAGADTLYGGDGNDRFEYAAASDLFAAGLLVDSINGGAGTNAITLNSPSAGFTIAATDSWASRIANVSQIVVSGATTGQISITLNDDAYEAGLRAVNISGDTNSVGNRIDVSAESGSVNGYVLTGHSGVDTIIGGAGNDSILGGGSMDILSGGAGDDFFYYPSLGSLFASNAFIDDIDGGTGTNAIVLDGTSTSFSILSTYSWASRITNISKMMLGGPTTGIMSFLVSDSAYEAGLRVIDLSADTEAAVQPHVVSVSAELGSSNGYTIIGHVGADSLTGGVGADTINGGAGNDTLSGGSNADVLSGGEGNDLLTGANGNDTLTGGDGSDIFVFGGNASSNGSDTITDFTAGAGGDMLRFTSFFLGSGSYGTSVTTAATGDVNISSKVAILRGAESSLDSPAEVFAFINGAGNAFSLNSGGRAVIITGSDSVVEDGSADYGRIFFVFDSISDGPLSASEVVLVAITQVDFNVANLVSGNFNFS